MTDNRDPGAEPDDTQPTSRPQAGPDAAPADQASPDPGQDQVLHEAYSPVPPPPLAAPHHQPAQTGRFSGLLAGGRTTIAAAVIAVLLLVGAGAAGFALASGDGNGNGGNGRDRSSQDRDGGRDRGGDDNDDDGAAANTAASVEEEPLTGTVLAQVAEAVESEYPGAVIERAETDADGVYEAHVTTAAGDDITVELDEQFAVTGTEDD